MNLTVAEVMIDQGKDERSGSREMQDPIRLHPHSHLPNPTHSVSRMESLPVERNYSNYEAFLRDDDPLAVLAYAGRLVEGGSR